MKEHLDLLGWAVQDKVTGFKGTVTHVGCDLQGCVQAIVHPRVTLDEKGGQKLGESVWFDVTRLECLGRGKVMEPIPMKIQGPEMNKPTK